MHVARMPNARIMDHACLCSLRFFLRQCAKVKYEPNNGASGKQDSSTTQRCSSFVSTVHISKKPVRLLLSYCHLNYLFKAKSNQYAKKLSNLSTLLSFLFQFGFTKLKISVIWTGFHNSYLKNLGYCPTIYMMFEAIIALLSFPLFISTRPRRS